MFILAVTGPQLKMKLKHDKDVLLQMHSLYVTRGEAGGRNSNWQGQQQVNRSGKSRLECHSGQIDNLAKGRGRAGVAL